MTNDPLAKRGSPRFCAQITMLARLLCDLLSENWYEREQAFVKFCELQDFFLSEIPIVIRGKQRKLAQHLLQVTGEYHEDNRCSRELHLFSMRLTALKNAFLARHSAYARKMQRKLLTECERLDRCGLQAKCRELAWSYEQQWKLMLEEDDVHELAVRLLHATQDAMNVYLRTIAYRWIAEQRSTLPLDCINSCDVCECIEQSEGLLQHSTERYWAAVAIVITLWEQGVQKPDLCWSRAQALVDGLLAGDELQEAGYEVALLRDFFTR